ncbi:MAG: N-methyl-L-tryptophan oxidase [Terriglobales bacterium]
MRSQSHVAVVGAGSFGGWTALYLLRRGARVTLLDAWGPGNERSSSGGDTRVMRGTYGTAQPYTEMAARAMELWKEHERQWKCSLFHPTGVLWMVTADDDQFERESLARLREAGIRFEELSAAGMARRWPQINFEDARWGILEPDSGFLFARAACQTVVDRFVAEGGEYKKAAVVCGRAEPEYGLGLTLADNLRVMADQYVFACGPWLGKLFPETIGNIVRPTKQDLFLFGPPAGDDRFLEARLPVWADHGDRFIYGIPAGDGRGFKIGDDTRGPEFDPTSGERAASPETLELIREYLGFRFPAMKGAPLVETQVCQYENTPDSHFIIDRHPQAQNVWIVGGGSGHGFKHGPAIGEMVARLIMSEESAAPVFSLDRFVEKQD